MSNMQTKLFKIHCISCQKEVVAKQPFRKYCGDRKDLNSCMYKQQLTISKACYHKAKKEGRYIKKYDPLVDRRIKLKKNFGLTVQDYNEMSQSQKGVCSICQKKQTAKYTKYLFVDHDHKTGKVRGLLCDRCNKGIGFFFDDVKLLERAIIYLSSN